MTSNILSKWRNRRAPQRSNPNQITVEQLQARIKAEGDTAPTVPTRRRPPTGPDWPVVEPPQELDAERTQPLIRLGMPEEVYKILDGRFMKRHVIQNFDTRDCEWCWTKTQQPTAVRISSGEFLEHTCLRPSCFHEALSWLCANAEPGHDILAEIAARPAQVLA